MLYIASKAEEERAIRYLMDNIPKDCMEKLMDKIQNEGDRWLLSQHLRFGMYIRNTLREGGFNWNSLDYMWSPLIRQAVRIMQYKFGPASQSEQIVYGARRPGYHLKNPSPSSEDVREWITFMKKRDIKRICCLLPRRQLSYYNEDLLDIYHKEFGQDNICWADIEDFHLSDKDKLIKKIIPFLKESERNKEKVVVHCSGGSGRTGHVLAAWLVYQHGLSLEEAISTVRGMGREPCEAVFAKKATEDELINLLEAYK